MKCPACKSVALEPREPEPGLSGRGCPACLGLYLPFAAFFAWQTRQTAVESHAAMPPATAVGPDSDGGKLCPGCGRFMARFRVALDLPFHVDRCGGCAGMWCDKGEWEQLRARGLHSRLHTLFSDSKQHHLKEEERRRQHEDRYRALLGDEFFARARDFKQWLDVHPQRGVVLAYLGDKTQD